MRSRFNFGYFDNDTLRLGRSFKEMDISGFMNSMVVQIIDDECFLADSKSDMDPHYRMACKFVSLVFRDGKGGFTAKGAYGRDGWFIPHPQFVGQDAIWE